MVEIDMPILVVDDTRFSAAFMVSALTKAGYGNVHSTSTGEEALRYIDNQPVSILLVDWMMPGMDGLELCRQVRQKDTELRHFTYIVLITGKDSPQAILEAFGCGVDDFIDKNRLKVELLPRVFAASRIANLQNSLLLDNATLADGQQARNRDGIEIDPVSGLGNARYAALRLRDALSQCNGRGGQVWYLAMGIANAPVIIEKYGEGIYASIIEELTRRIKHLVRPLDFVARLSEARFAVICYVDSEEREFIGALKRVHDSLNHKEIKTDVGFMDVTVGTAMLVINQKQSESAPEQIMAGTEAPLRVSFSSGLFECRDWPLKKQDADPADPEGPQI